MCLRFVFLLITRVAAGLRLSRREEMWNTAEILILRHQLSVLQRRQPRRPKAGLGGPGPARCPARRHTASAAPGAAAADYPGHDRALAPRHHRPPPLGRPVRVRQDRPASDPARRRQHPARVRDGRVDRMDSIRRISGRGVRGSAAAGRWLSGVPGRVQDGGGTVRCSWTQLDLMGHDPEPAPR